MARRFKRVDYEQSRQQVVTLDEHLGAMSVDGLLFILGGSWLSTGGRPSP